MPSLWGGALFYEPTEEAELLAELGRIAGAWDLGTSRTDLERALRVGAGELVCFVPARRRAEPVPYTLEGDKVSIAEAWWEARDPDAVLQALSEIPDLWPGGETDDGGRLSRTHLPPLD